VAVMVASHDGSKKISVSEKARCEKAVKDFWHCQNIDKREWLKNKMISFQFPVAGKQWARSEVRSISAIFTDSLTTDY
jgi:hypothetical protein